MNNVLIANRGAAASRIIRAVEALGLKPVVVYSEADAQLPYVQQAREAYCIGPAPARESYLNQEALLECMRRSGADALHPGYGFLSENAAFARRVEEAGHCFIGPSPRWIELLGHKAAARSFMREHGLALGDSSPVLPMDDMAAVHAAAQRLGYPVLIKPAGGGGGIGMVPVHAADALEAGWQRAGQLAGKAFADPSLYLERFVQSPRHIEFQFIADRHGHVMSLFERDCSTQRRYQKVIEEAPAPSIERAAVEDMCARLERLLGNAGYDVIGTVEMLYTPDTGFSFLEVNTRLQVEHAVTEAVTGVDLVQAQIRLAGGEPLSSSLRPGRRCKGMRSRPASMRKTPCGSCRPPACCMNSACPRGCRASAWRRAMRRATVSAATTTRWSPSSSHTAQTETKPSRACGRPSMARASKGSRPISPWCPRCSRARRSGAGA